MSQIGTPSIRNDKNLARLVGDLRDSRQKATLDAAKGLGTLGTPEIRKAAKLREAIKDENNRMHWKAGRLDLVGHKFLVVKCKEGDGRAWKEMRRREKIPW